MAPVLGMTEHHHHHHQFFPAAAAAAPSEDGGSPSKLLRRHRPQQNHSFLDSKGLAGRMIQPANTINNSNNRRSLFLTCGTRTKHGSVIIAVLSMLFLYSAMTNVTRLDPSSMSMSLGEKENANLQIAPHALPPLASLQNDRRDEATVVQSQPKSSSFSTTHSTLDSFPTTSKPVETGVGNDGNKNTKTLALLYPPGLLGGYRNQVLRFIALCVHGKRHGISQLLLPSLLWSTQLDGIGTHVSWFPIPFDWIFDVEYWNTFAPHNLPRLVRTVMDSTNEIGQGKTRSDCWIEASEYTGDEQLLNGEAISTHNNHDLTTTDSMSSHGRTVQANETQSNVYYYSYPLGDNNNNKYNVSVLTINHLQRAALLQGTLKPLQNITVLYIAGLISFNPRKHDLTDLVQSCQNPIVYGGGTGAGKLWKDYVTFQSKFDQRQPRRKEKSTLGSLLVSNKSVVPYETDVWVYRALQPATRWRAVADRCVKQHAPTGHYIAVHARVELEIMGHVCGLYMEKNLTRIIQRVSQLYNDLTMPQQRVSSSTTIPQNISGLFVAVSRAGMADTRSSSYQNFKAYADENLRVLDRLTKREDESGGLPHFEPLQTDYSVLPIFECGEGILQEFYANNPGVPNHGALLQSVINFHIAVSADVFVGVSGSSYSTDVLTTRYWLGKGRGNYRYTTKGTDLVENGGLPRPHSNCKK